LKKERMKRESRLKGRLGKSGPGRVRTINGPGQTEKNVQKKGDRESAGSGRGTLAAKKKPAVGPEEGKRGAVD